MCVTPTGTGCVRAGSGRYRTDRTHCGGTGDRRRRGSCESFFGRLPVRRPQAGLPAVASTGVRAFTLGVRALLRMSVFTYFVE